MPLSLSSSTKWPFPAYNSNEELLQLSVLRLHVHTHSPLHAALSSPTNPCREFLKIPASPAVFKASENFIQICSRVLTERNSHHMHFFLEQPPRGCLTPPEMTSLHSETDTIRKMAAISFFPFFFTAFPHSLQFSI